MWSWFRNWRQREEIESDLAEELQSHLAIEKRLQVESGLDPKQAQNKARQLFGNITGTQEEARETWGWAEIVRVFDDVKYGLRMLRKSPAWTAVLFATLALGIGLSTAIFSTVYGVLLRPLPYPDYQQLVALWPSAPKQNYARFNVSAALYGHWKAQSKMFSDIALTRPIANFNLTGVGAPERLQGARTSANLSAVLGIAPLLGRAFTTEEQLSDAKVALLSYRLWQRRFGEDRSIIGRKIPLSGTPYEVIGVMPEEFRYPSPEFELWTPLYIPPDEIRSAGNYQYIAVARLKPAVTVQQAREEMRMIMHGLAQDFKSFYRLKDEDLGVLIEPLAESDASAIGQTLWALLAATGCLLLIGCMNLAVLLVARASARTQEIALRVALGASGGRVRRQILAELLPIGCAGACGGLLVAWWLLKALRPMLPASTPRVNEIALHGPVLAFAVCASLIVILLAGLLPAHIASRSVLASSLRQNSRSVTGGSARNWLVIGQVALTVVLVIGGALFARSLQELLKVRTGFATQNVLTMHLAVTRAKYGSDPQVAEYYNRILGRIRSVPGVLEAGIVNRLPLSGIAQTGGVEFEGIDRVFDSDWRSATPGYFEAMGIPIESGRTFTATDRDTSPKVGIIDGAIAHKAFGNANPIGRRFRMSIGTLKAPWVEIIGVVGHVLNDSLEKDPRPQVYWPETQRTQDRGALVVRTSGPPLAFTSAVVEQIRAEDSDQPVYDIRAMEQWLGRTLQSRNLLTATVALFSATSLLLACLGLYGVVTFAAGQRLREFGIRMALGARGIEVGRLVLTHAARLALSGTAIGLLLAWPATLAIKSLLYGVALYDPLSWLAAPTLLTAVALISANGPARKAAKADPAITLRTE